MLLPIYQSGYKCEISKKETVSPLNDCSFWSRADVVKQCLAFHRDALWLAGRQLVAKSLPFTALFRTLPDICSALSVGAGSPLHPTSTGKTTTFATLFSLLDKVLVSVLTTNLFLFASVDKPVSKDTIATAVLSIERVSTHHFKSEFTCRGKGFYKDTAKSVTLKQRGQC